MRNSIADLIRRLRFKRIGVLYVPGTAAPTTASSNGDIKVTDMKESEAATRLAEIWKGDDHLLSR